MCTLDCEHVNECALFAKLSMFMHTHTHTHLQEEQVLVFMALAEDRSATHDHDRRPSDLHTWPLTSPTGLLYPYHNGLQNLA